MICYRELATVEKDLGVPLRTLFAVSNNITFHYKTVKIPKKNGSIRVLTVPDHMLKSIQRKILNKMLVYRPVSRYATAYKFCSSLVKNAAPHVGKSKILKLDISSFFDNVLFSQVKQYVFPEEIYSEPIRILLSILCYKGDGLPQGAPTSPAISNIILYDFDERVGAMCEEKGISYTRYCDDMTFSGEFDENEIIATVKKELLKYGLFINAAKTSTVCSGSRQNVTGIVVNEKLNTEKSYRAKIRKEVYFIKKFGVRAHIEKIGCECTPREYLSGLLGRVAFVLSVTPQNSEMLEYKKFIIELLKKEDNTVF